MDSRPKYLSLLEASEYLNNFTDSEDDFEENSDAEESDPDRPVIEPEIEEDIFDIQNMPVIVINNESDLNVLNLINEVPNDVINETNEVKELKKKYSKIIWKIKNLEVVTDQFEFIGNESLPSEISNLESPLQIFNYLFDSNLKEKIVFESNYYANEQNIQKSTVMTKKDLEKYIGISILTSVHQVTSLRRYWGHEIGNNIIRDTLSINKFEKIRKILHFNCNDNCLPRTDPKYDRLFKLRPLIASLTTNFKKVPVERNISIDEQICLFKGLLILFSKLALN